MNERFHVTPAARQLDRPRRIARLDRRRRVVVTAPEPYPPKAGVAPHQVDDGHNVRMSQERRGAPPPRWPAPPGANWARRCLIRFDVFVNDAADVGDFRANRVRSALAGRNPTVLRRLWAGFAVIGDVQHLPGYCVLITDTPGVDQLTDLSVDRQIAFLGDMALLGRTVSAVCRRRDPEFRRINLEIQGNTDTFLHAHVTPRYHWEPADIIGWPAALHHWTQRVDYQAAALGPQHDALRSDLVDELERQHQAIQARNRQEVGEGPS